MRHAWERQRCAGRAATTAAGEALGEELSAWAESDEFDVANPVDVLAGADAAAAGRAVMEAIVGREALERAIGGRSADLYDREADGSLRRPSGDGCGVDDG